MFLRLFCIIQFVFAANVYADIEIIHFDVGMGDSTLIIDTNSKKTVLIDAGNRGKGTSVLLPALRKLGLNKIDYFVATHYDADHIGGIDELIDGEVAIGQFMDRGDYTNRTRLTKKGNITQFGEYKDLITVDAYKKIDLSNDCPAINMGETKIWFVVASGFYAKSLFPCVTTSIKISKTKDNDLSIGMLVEHKGFRYFIGGDLTGGGKSTKDMESKIAALVGDLNVF